MQISLTAQGGVAITRPCNAVTYAHLSSSACAVALASLRLAFAAATTAPICRDKMHIWGHVLDMQHRMPVSTDLLVQVGLHARQHFMRTATSAIN